MLIGAQALGHGKQPKGDFTVVAGLEEGNWLQEGNDWWRERLLAGGKPILKF